MMRAVLYDTRSGHIIAVGDAESMLRRMGDHADIVAFSQGASDASHYVTDGAVTPREEWASAALDRADILADGVDAATLSGLPDPCWIDVNGEPVEVVGGEFEITAPTPGLIRVEMIGRYIGVLWLISAHDLSTLKTTTKTRIDAAAEAARLQYITAGAGQAMVYEQKNAEAKRFFEVVNNGETTSPADYVILAAEATAKGETLLNVATLVRDTAAAWLPIAAMIEAKRMAGKKAVDAAATVSAVLAAETIDWSTP